MDLSINLINSSESSLASQQQFLRNLPVDAKVEDLSLESLQLLVYYLFKQGPYELASLKGFTGTLQEWLNSLKTTLSLKAYVNLYTDLKNVPDLKEGDLVFVKETSKVYLYTQGSFQEKEDGLNLTGLSAYDIAVNLGFQGTSEEWLQSLKGDKFTFEDFTGEELELLKGDKGASAYQVAVENGFTGSEKAWLESLKGVKGDTGTSGLKGEVGKDGSSAYQLAVQQGFEGTIQEYVKSLEGKQGEQGLSAYELALKAGFQGSLQDFLESLKGLSAYELDVLEGFKGTLSEWVSSLKGQSTYQSALQNGFQGSEESFINSLKGLSAYELAVQQGYIGTLSEWLEDLQAESPYTIARKNGFKGSEEEWLDSLKGASAYSLALKSGYKNSLRTWLQSLKGMSSYEIAVAEGYVGTPKEWLLSLKGASAYALALETGFVGSQKDFLESLKGQRGLSPYEEDVNFGYEGSFEEWKEALRGKSAYDLVVEKGYKGTEEEWALELSTIKDVVLQSQNYLRETEGIKEVTSSLYKDTKLILESVESLYQKTLKNASLVAMDKEYLTQGLQQVQDYYKELDNKLNSVNVLLKDANESVFDTNLLLQRAEEVLTFTQEIKERLVALEVSFLELPSYKESISQELITFKEKLLKVELNSQNILSKINKVSKDFTDLNESLPYLLKSYEYIVTDSGLSLKEYLLDTFKVLFDAQEEQRKDSALLSQDLSKKVVSINGKKGADINITAEDIPNVALKDTFEKTIVTLQDNLSEINNNTLNGLPPVFNTEHMSQVGGYPKNARIMLDNGSLVKSLVASNKNNPNISLLGWAIENDSQNILCNMLPFNKERTLFYRLAEQASIKDFGAIGDGVLHPLSEWIDNGTFTSLAAIKAVFPFVNSLTQSIDWVATQYAALNCKDIHCPAGVYILSDVVKTPHNVSPYNTAQTSNGIKMYGDGSSTSFRRNDSRPATRVYDEEGTSTTQISDEANLAEACFSVHSPYTSITNMSLNESAVGLYLGQDYSKPFTSLSSVAKSNFENLTIDRCGTGILLLASGGNHYCTFSDIHFSSCQIDIHQRASHWWKVIQSRGDSNNNRNVFTRIRSARSRIGLWNECGDTNNYFIWHGESIPNTNNPFPLPEKLPLEVTKETLFVFSGSNQLNTVANSFGEDVSWFVYNDGYQNRFVSNGFSEDKITMKQMPREWRGRYASRDRGIGFCDNTYIAYPDMSIPGQLYLGLGLTAETPVGGVRTVSKDSWHIPAINQRGSFRRDFQIETGSLTANTDYFFTIWGNSDASTSGMVDIDIVARCDETGQTSTYIFKGIANVYKASTRAPSRYFLNKIMASRASSQGGGDTSDISNLKVSLRQNPDVTQELQIGINSLFNITNATIFVSQKTTK